LISVGAALAAMLLTWTGQGIAAKAAPTKNPHAFSLDDIPRSCSHKATIGSAEMHLLFL
jgi:hypothetical protein